ANKIDPAQVQGISVTGGYVYRGRALAGWQGKYIFADWSRNWALPDGVLLVASPNSQNGEGRWTLDLLPLVSPANGKVGAYIVAGVLIGPHALPFPLITDQQTIHTLSELGLVFLLFALGLEFNFRKIRQIGVTAFIVAPLETGLMFFAGYQIGQLFGWSKTD